MAYLKLFLHNITSNLQSDVSSLNIKKKMLTYETSYMLDL